MKHKLFITILPLVMNIITSCSKDKYQPLDTSSNNVSATITIANNTPFQFSATGAAVKTYPLISNPSIYRIEATDANNNNLIIVIENVTQTGTYPFTSNDVLSGSGLAFIKNGIGLASQFTYSTKDPAITNKGSVTITALNNHHIEGVFTAFCEREDQVEAAQITNGSFKGNF